jgi:predicted enzyme related to lactoylglutathione lyase
MIKKATLVIATVNFEQLLQFYQYLLQQKPNIYKAEVYAEFSIFGLNLGIFRPKTSHEVEFSYPWGSGYSLCLEVADLEATITHIIEIGFPVDREIIESSHGREIYIYDPDGNRLILHQSYS